MKLPEPESCQWESADGNFKTLTALGESSAAGFSDASSTLAASTKVKILSRKRQDFCFVFFILQFSVYIIDQWRQDFLNEYRSLKTEK